MRPRVLLVGEAPAPRDRTPLPPGWPLTGPSGRRIAALAGIAFWPAYLRRTERMNLLPLCPVEWTALVARAARRNADAVDLTGRRAILCGRNVATAFGLKAAPWFEWMVHRGGIVAVIPHPSGRNHMWNDPAVVAAASGFLTAALKEDRWPSSDALAARG